MSSFWHSGSVAFGLLALLAHGDDCIDNDEAVAQLTAEQMGQAVSCEQLIFGNPHPRICDDPTFAQQLCCQSCNTRHQQLQGEVRKIWQDFAGPIERAQSLLRDCPRTKPLHGRGSGMPLLALGTHMGFQGVLAMESALHAGYRHLDTALMYENHAFVKEAVLRSGLSRDEIFITTKVPPERMGFKGALDAIEKIREEMPDGYADLCLVHWPHSQDSSAEGTRQTLEMSVVERAGTWRALEQAFESGICKAIGVSNYMVKHLQELDGYARIKPSVNQLEYSPLAPLADVDTYCRKNDIVLQAFGWRHPDVLEHPKVRRLAEDLGRPPSEIVVLWMLQQGQAPLYQSQRLERLLEHAEVLRRDRAMLSEEQIEELRLPQESYKWRYYTGRYVPKPWETPVMADR